MTKKILVLTVCIAVFSVLWGCQGAHKTRKRAFGEPRNANEGAGVIIKDSGEFPDFLVGTWQPNKSKWVFTFEPDGRISKIRHFVGMEFDVAEGGLVEQWRGSIEAIYVLETCEARYNPETRELRVTVVVDPFIMNFIDGSMEGSFHDYLTGRVSQDGTTWNVTWTSTSEIIGGGSIDPNKVVPKQLTFRKVMDNVTD